MNTLILDLGTNKVKTEAHNPIGTIGPAKVEMQPDGQAKLTLSLMIDGKELLKILPAKKSEAELHAEPKRAIKV